MVVLVAEVATALLDEPTTAGAVRIKEVGGVCMRMYLLAADLFPCCCCCNSIPGSGNGDPVAAAIAWR